MKKIIFFTIVFLLGTSFWAIGQTVSNEHVSETYKKMPQEKVFVHYNTSLLLSGEYLYYKVYCLNTKSDSLSNFSKIAYVELVGVDKVPVFKHKIVLNSGLGQGDFFIPTTIKSGNYKLIAYTQWMKNLDQNQFFQSDISIINPFQSNQSSILVKNDPILSQNINLDTTKIENNNIPMGIIDNDYIDLSINTNSFKNREKVVLNIKSLKGDLSYGNYSISVRKIDTLRIPKNLTASTYMSSYNEISHNSNTARTIYLPELRGELLWGTVFNNDTNLPASYTKVAFSIPGEQPIFKITSTNELGVFYFNIYEKYENDYAIIQVVDNERNNFNIKLSEHLSVNYDSLSFYNFKMTSRIKDYLLKRSIYNQIENVYSEIKPNTFESIDSITPFYNSKAKVYFLDDYTRFPTIKETIVEVINEVYIKQKKDNSAFHVKLYNQTFESDKLPLVLVDGILIQNHDELLNSNVKNIEKVSIVSDLILYDSETYEGLISFETFKGNYQTNISGSFIKKVSLFKPLGVKKYFNQKYDEDKKSDRIPDFRSQLLWSPNFNLDKETDSLSFYTSDNSGDFEICLEGFTNMGKPISIKKIFSVK